MKSLYKDLALGGAIASLSVAPSTMAQISADGTLSSPTTVNGTLPNYVIEGGTTAGDNLFHSFSEFSIPTGGSAAFDLTATPNIANIIGRVTSVGSAYLSNLDGAMLTMNGNNPAVNLFLLNPNGITFGPNSQFLMGGDLFATTADSFVFENGFEFGTSTPQSPSILTVSTPTGLQMGTSPGSILVQSKAPAGGSGFLGLQVNPGQTLALLGGDVSIEQSGLHAVDGHVEIGGIAGDQFLQLETTSQGWNFDYEAVGAFRDITLVNASAINTSGPSGGSVHVKGQNIRLSGGSPVLANTFGPGNGGGITINASALIDLQGTTPDGSIPSGLFSQVAPGATGQGGDLFIESPIVWIVDGAQAGTGTFGPGNAGDVFIRAQEVVNRGISDNLIYPSGVRTTVLPGATGRGGDLTIETQRLQVLDGAQAGAGTFGDGDSGNLSVTATEVEIAGSTPNDIYMSGLFTQVIPGASGQGGDLNLKTQQLLIREGGTLSADTLGNGNAGNLQIDAEQISVVGVSATGRSPSRLGAGVLSIPNAPVPVGNGGDITLNTRSLRLAEGGQVATSTAGRGTAGNVIVMADQIDVTGSGQLTLEGQVPSRLAATSESDFAAGSVRLSTNEITVQAGGEISVSSTGNGEAGDLIVGARILSLRTGGRLSAEVNVGDQGNIRVDTDVLLMRQSGNITTNAGAQANGGNIIINSPFIIGLENSDITANAQQGQGGNVEITTQALYGLEFRDRLTPESDITASSEFGVSGTVDINNPAVDPGTALVELPKTLTDSDEQIAATCSTNGDNQFIASGRGGVPSDPTHLLANAQVWNDVRDLSMFNPSGNGVHANQGTPVTHRSMAENIIVEAAGWTINENNQVELLTTSTESDVEMHQASCLPQANIDS